MAPGRGVDGRQRGHGAAAHPRARPIAVRVVRPLAAVSLTKLDNKINISREQREM